MSNTISSQIIERLQNPEHCKAVDDSGRKFKLTLAGGKRYLITLNDKGKFEVVRDYNSTARFDWAKAKLARFFKCTNRQFIQTTLKKTPGLLNSIGWLGGSSVHASQRPSTGCTVLTDSESCSTGFIVVKKYSKKENESAEKIQRNARIFLTRLRKARKAAQEAGDAGTYNRFCMTNPTRTDYQGKPLKYYFDRDGIYPAVRRPAELVVQGARGGEKQLKAKDERFVELASVTDFGFSPQISREIRETAKEFARYPSCCPGVQIDKGTILARSGGAEMGAMMKADPQKVFDINCFKQSCIDLKDMHLRKIFLRDIKAENMGVRKSRHGQEQAMFIDTDSAAVPALNNYKEEVAAKATTTQRLLEGQRAGNLELIKAGDNYAKLLLMTEATDPELRKQPAVYVHSFPVFVGGQFKKAVEYEPFQVSRVSVQNVGRYNAWVDKHVKPEYRDEVKNFLINPSRNKLSAELVDVIKWTV